MVSAMVVREVLGREVGKMEALELVLHHPIFLRPLILRLM
jgi:hypothetical protein